MTITRVQHRKGTTTEAYAAKVSYKGIHFHATYDCLNDNLIIDKWYSFEADELSALRQNLMKYFRDLIAEGKAS